MAVLNCMEGINIINGMHCNKILSSVISSLLCHIYGILTITVCKCLHDGLAKNLMVFNEIKDQIKVS